MRSDELGLSQIIRWLFDAKGSHGQRGLFLRRYLDEVADEKIFEGVNCDAATAACEVLTTHTDHAGRRIDILIEVGDCYLAIENKPWAVWQENQLGAYFEDIQRRHGDKDCRILALKGWVGDSPANLIADIPSDRLIDTDYTKFAAILRDTIPQCKAEPIRRFVEKLVDYLDHLFRGKSMSVFSDEIAKHIIGDTDLSASAFDLIGSRYELFDELARKLDGDIEGNLAGEELELIERLSSHGTGVPYPSLAIRGARGPVFRVAFYRGLEGAYWGLKEKDNANVVIDRESVADAEREQALSIFEGGGWIWWEHLINEARFDTNADVWKAMNDGTLAKEIVSRAAISIQRAAQMEG